jgi:DNA-binding MarR family transcriptional regulator
MEPNQLTSICLLTRKEMHPELTVTQLTILSLVAQKEGITHAELAKLLETSQASIHRNISRLMMLRPKSGVPDEGFLHNKEDIIDPRRHAVFLTERGHKFLQELSSANNSLEVIDKKLRTKKLTVKVDAIFTVPADFKIVDIGDDLDALKMNDKYYLLSFGCMLVENFKDYRHGFDENGSNELSEFMDSMSVEMDMT